MTNETWRTFLAVDFGGEIKDRVAVLLKKCSGIPEKIKWVEPGNFHLTLKFLGPTPMEKKSELLQAVRETAGRQVPFDVVLSGVGGFPSLARPRVVWIGIGQGALELASLAMALEESLVPLGFAPEDREFSPHATIGRVKFLKHPVLLQEALAPDAAVNFGQSEIKMITWYKSTLTSEGPIYEVLEAIPFLK